MRSLRKRNANLCAILDMKVSNTDIIDTVTDEKKLNLCLIQGWCFQKSLSTVPNSENYAIEWFQPGSDKGLFKIVDRIKYQTNFKRQVLTNRSFFQKSLKEPQLLDNISPTITLFYKMLSYTFNVAVRFYHLAFSSMSTIHIFC